jgi:hypothetical protein
VRQRASHTLHLLLDRLTHSHGLSRWYFSLRIPPPRAADRSFSLIPLISGCFCVSSSACFFAERFRISCASSPKNKSVKEEQELSRHSHLPFDTHSSHSFVSRHAVLVRQRTLGRFNPFLFVSACVWFATVLHVHVRVVSRCSIRSSPIWLLRCCVVVRGACFAGFAFLCLICYFSSCSFACVGCVPMLFMLVVCIFGGGGGGGGGGGMLFLFSSTCKRSFLRAHATCPVHGVLSMCVCVCVCVCRMDTRRSQIGLRRDVGPWRIWSNS